MPGSEEKAGYRLFNRYLLEIVRLVVISEHARVNEVQGRDRTILGVDNWG